MPSLTKEDPYMVFPESSMRLCKEYPGYAEAPLRVRQKWPSLGTSPLWRDCVYLLITSLLGCLDLFLGHCFLYKGLWQWRGHLGSCSTLQLPPSPSPFLCSPPEHKFWFVLDPVILFSLRIKCEITRSSISKPSGRLDLWNFLWFAPQKGLVARMLIKRQCLFYLSHLCHLWIHPWIL